MTVPAQAHHGLSSYRVCLSQPYAVALISSNLLGRIPNGMATLAIVLFLRASGRSFAEVGVVIASFGLASAVGGPVLGRAIDRAGQVLVLTAAGLGSAAGFCLLTTVGEANLLYVEGCVVLAGLLSPPLEPALRSLWSTLLTDRATIEVAYALDTSLQELLYILGPFLAVMLFAVLPAEVALYVLSATMVIGTVLFVSLPPVRHWQPPARTPDWAGALRSRTLVVILASMFWVGSSIGVLNVVVVAYAEQAGSQSYSGGLLGTASIGGLVGGLLYGARRWRGDGVRRLRWLLAAMALAYLPLALTPPPALMFAFMFAAGFFLAPVLACGFVLIAGHAPAGTVTEAFAWVTTLFLAGSALGSSISGVSVGGTLGLRGSFLLTALCAAVALLVAVVALRGEVAPTGDGAVVE
ncbi:MAG TPA: MFS transporter [Jatrophihabitans sp.]|jgi:MFS family permease|uniref:MFS transporter n=1 Tax=Jatrophihabitans sp. TaxID=1932789 RepID=UPI002F19DCE5